MTKRSGARTTQRQQSNPNLDLPAEAADHTHSAESAEGSSAKQSFQLTNAEIHILRICAHDVENEKFTSLMFETLAKLVEKGYVLARHYRLTQKGKDFLAEWKQATKRDS